MQHLIGWRPSPPATQACSQLLATLTLYAAIPRISIVGIIQNFDVLSLLSVTSTECHYALEATKAC